MQWPQLPSCENSWEDIITVIGAFPTLHLEDNFEAGGGGGVIDSSSVVRPALTKFYTRRDRRLS